MLELEYRIMPPAAVVNAMYNHTNQELKKMTFELHIKESMMSFFRHFDDEAMSGATSRMEEFKNLAQSSNGYAMINAMKRYFNEQEVMVYRLLTAFPELHRLDPQSLKLMAEKSYCTIIHLQATSSFDGENLAFKANEESFNTSELTKFGFSKGAIDNGCSALNQLAQFKLSRSHIALLCALIYLSPQKGSLIKEDEIYVQKLNELAADMFVGLMKDEKRGGETFRIFAAVLEIHRYCQSNGNWESLSKYQPKIVMNPDIVDNENLMIT